MASEGFGVRVFEIEPDGTLTPHICADEDYFSGTVPNVGDTIAMWHLHDVYRFYNVQRRYFIDSPDDDRGWCVIVRLIDPAPQLENVVTEWSEDTKFWRSVEEQERKEEQERIAEVIRKLTVKKPRQTPPEQVKKTTRNPRKKVLKPRTPKA
ncbi:hypothetical protein DTW90_23875 [Neorhizobium sp. P12A]|uniref:hypothetical protein n=1 Tax=Neorhizobium sp. P12A TaxID=2268027 RepID=UPI0011ED1DF9|nr:hypothetical protein [Neorhizobium sp. P12A]KAA0694372.1 hypothetical protein DTW90_23875 [Neorhizobium sp. P12A]